MLDGLVAQSAADDHAASKEQEQKGKEHLASWHHDPNLCLFLRLFSHSDVTGAAAPPKPLHSR